MLERMAAPGKTCEPRLKSQRVSGSERDAGWDCSSGMSNRERVAMPPDARSAVDILAIWMMLVVVVDIVGRRTLSLSIGVLTKQVDFCKILYLLFPWGR